MSRLEDIEHGPRLDLALLDQDKDVIEEVGRLPGEGLAGRLPVGAGDLCRCVVLGGEEDLGGLFGDLA